MGDVTEGAVRRPRWKLWLRLIFRICLFLAFLALVAGAVGFAYVYKKYGTNLPDISTLETYRPAETTKILASDGSVISTLYQENRVWASYDKLSPWIVPALLATEDSRYFDHKGVDPIGIARVIFNTAVTGDAREGASTITMQLSRAVFPLGDVDWERKLKELFLAMEIERHYSKEKILELYLNQVYFGGGAYGIHSAAGVYFNKGPGQLTLSEAALIAGLIQAPSRFSPLEHPERAFVRQDEVLGRMKSVGAITQAQFDEAIVEREKMKFGDSSQRAFEVDRFPYFTSYVVSEVSARFSEEDLYRGGLTIVTTLDPALQTRAQEVLAAEVNALGWELNVDSGALVVLENGTGYIKALVGGLGWTPKNQFNRAYQTRRQPGSSFKPATYGTALESGYTPESRINDSAVTYQDGSAEGWSPKNSDGKFLGVITLRQALRGSRNVAAVKLLDAVGVDKVIDLAYRMGIRSAIPANLSIALGAVDASPLEMAEFYSVIANRGTRIAPSAIKVIKDSSGRVLEDHRGSEGRRVLSEQTALALISMLGDVVNSGTGTNAQVSGWPISGKTGTTDESRDAWFCGFSPYYVCTVWVGNDDNTPMYRSYGGDLPATIFRQVMSFALEGKEYKDFPAYTPGTEGAKDVLSGGETPKPSGSPSPEASATPEVEETPQATETLLPESNPTPGAGDSYLLPETLDPAGPGARPQPKPAFTPAAALQPKPLVTPAPLPEDRAPPKPRIEIPADSVDLPSVPDISEPPPPSEVKLPSLETP